MIPPKTIERQIEDSIETDIDAAEELRYEQDEDRVNSEDYV